jgi:hypothetical protein
MTPLMRLIEIYKTSRRALCDADTHEAMLKHAQEIEKALTVAPVEGNEPIPGPGSIK